MKIVQECTKCRQIFNGQHKRASHTFIYFNLQRRWS